MSRSGTRDMNLVPKDKVPAFIKLAKAIERKYGMREADRRMDCNRGHRWQSGTGACNLSVTAARKILDAYKAMKREEQDAAPETT